MSNQVFFRSDHRKLIVLAIAAVFLAGLAWYARTYLTLEGLAGHEAQIRSAIAARPFRSFVIGFAVYTLVALVPGTGGKAIVYGWLFGFWQAFTIVTVGLAIAAMVIFYLSRYLIQDSIERRYTRALALMNKHLAKEGAFYLVTLRLLHVPYSIINPVSGASRVPARTFFWTTVVGLAPSNAIWAYVGLRLPTLGELAEKGAMSFIDLPLIGALIFSGILPFIIRWLIGRFGIPETQSEMEQANNHDSQQEFT